MKICHELILTARAPVRGADAVHDLAESMSRINEVSMIL